MMPPASCKKIDKLAPYIKFHKRNIDINFFDSILDSIWLKDNKSFIADYENIYPFSHEIFTQKAKEKVRKS